MRKPVLLLRKAIVDHRWRLTIPSAVADRESLLAEDEVFLTTKKDGCLEIYFDEPLSLSSKDPIIKTKTVRNKDDSQMRLTIPAFLREATSFFYGRSVMIADFREKLELWPRP